MLGFCASARSAITPPRFAGNGEVQLVLDDPKEIRVSGARDRNLRQFVDVAFFW
jgi:hypothetical protein